MITQEALKLAVSYCPDTGVFTWLVTKNQNAIAGSVAGGPVKYKSGKSYVIISINGRKYQAHRLAVLYMTGSFPDGNAGHNDGNGLNNRWDNLACETQAENCKNVRKRSDNTSGVVGVNWYPNYGKWRAVIVVDKKQVSLGYHDEFDDAVLARKTADSKHGFHVNHGQVRPL